MEAQAPPPFSCVPKDHTLLVYEQPLVTLVTLMNRLAVVLTGSLLFPCNPAFINAWTWLAAEASPSGGVFFQLYLNWEQCMLLTLTCTTGAQSAMIPGCTPNKISLQPPSSPVNLHHAFWLSFVDSQAFLHFGPPSQVSTLHHHSRLAVLLLAHVPNVLQWARSASAKLPPQAGLVTGTFSLQLSCPCRQ
eukprot:257878-Pelagomonas_calceolata.AAC.1